MHYYIQKGWDAEKFLGLDLMSRFFYQASMEAAIEERRKFFGAGR